MGHSPTVGGSGEKEACECFQWVNTKGSYQKAIFSAPPETRLLESGQRPSPAGIPVPPMSQSQQCPSPPRWAGDRSLGSGNATRGPSRPSCSGLGRSPRPRHGHYSWCPPPAFRAPHDSPAPWGCPGAHQGPAWHSLCLLKLHLLFPNPHTRTGSRRLCPGSCGFGGSLCSLPAQTDTVKSYPEVPPPCGLKITN